MNVQKQIEEYRKKQAERFKIVSKEEEKEEKIQSIPVVPKEETKGMDDDDRRTQEQIDMEIAQQLERELNFRQTYNIEPELVRSQPQQLFEDDIGEEGKTAAIPRPFERSNIRGSLPQSRDKNKYVRQPPPKWLVNPVKLDKSQKIKVYDFTEGSLNDERRNTNASSTFEFESIDDPMLKNHNVSDLETQFAKRQQKLLKRFEKDEERRWEEAKRSGSIVEDYRRDSDIERRPHANSIDEPLLNGRANLANNFMNQNAVIQPRRVFCCVYQQENGTFRIFWLRNLTKEFIIL